MILRRRFCGASAGVRGHDGDWATWFDPGVVPRPEHPCRWVSGSVDVQAHGDDVWVRGIVTEIWSGRERIAENGKTPLASVNANGNGTACAVGEDLAAAAEIGVSYYVSDSGCDSRGESSCSNSSRHSSNLDVVV